MNWLKEYIDYQRISILSFEKSLGTRSTIDKAIKNNTNLRSDLLTKIIEVYPDINPSWLLTGKGNMLKNKTLDLFALSIEEMSIYIHDHLPEFENNKTFNMVVDGVIKNRLIKELEKKERIIEELENKNKKLKG